MDWEKKHRDEPILKKTIVLSGGGIKGIIHIGALYAMYILGLKFNKLVGTSVGGLVAALYTMGYSASELYSFIKEFQTDLIKNISFSNLISFGLDDGVNFEKILKELFKYKNYDENVTMKQLYDKTNIDLTLVTTCLNDMSTHYINHVNYPNLPIYMAIRMTTSIPFLFCPVIYENKYYVDGACLLNYPIQYVESELEQTIGILIKENKSSTDFIGNIETYLSRIIQTLSSSLYHNKYPDCTIEISIDPTNIYSFELSDAKKDELFMSGYIAVMNNIDKLQFKKSINVDSTGFDQQVQIIVEDEKETKNDTIKE